ncbi:MAG: hypothetical protein JOY58_01735, partial [Solirubrobacterales bacterium]|nr:hypothetical protein [Solirubrobacterales bacterium]
RDGRLPLGNHVARVWGASKIPVVPSLLVGALALALLAVNIANQQAFTALIGVAIIMFYLPYLGVTAPMLRARLRGEWPRPEHGPYFSMGRFGMIINAYAVVYGILVAINIGWPRALIYGNKWYFKWAAVEFIGATIVVGGLYYFLVQTRKPPEVLAEHRAEIPSLPGETLGEVAP